MPFSTTRFLMHGMHRIPFFSLCHTCTADALNEGEQSNCSRSVILGNPPLLVAQLQAGIPQCLSSLQNSCPNNIPALQNASAATCVRHPPSALQDIETVMRQVRGSQQAQGQKLPMCVHSCIGKCWEQCTTSNGLKRNLSNNSAPHPKERKRTQLNT